MTVFVSSSTPGVVRDLGLQVDVRGTSIVCHSWTVDRFPHFLPCLPRGSAGNATQNPFGQAAGV